VGEYWDLYCWFSKTDKNVVAKTRGHKSRKKMISEKKEEV
jgi:hypothetical protein